MTWSGSARPTGPDDSIMILQEISQAACSVWKSLSAFLDQYKEHRNAPDAAAWEEQRQQLYKQFAPLLDRVGRLTTDASQLLQFESAHEVMHQEECNLLSLLLIRSCIFPSCHNTCSNNIIYSHRYSYGFISQYRFEYCKW